jgi:hypothetical protein
MADRGKMEASENTGPPREGRVGTGLHRIDPVRVTETLGSAKHSGGYARLELMLNSVMPRLVGEPRTPKEG